jgi:type II secretory pathway pseudopilin PulG
MHIMKFLRNQRGDTILEVLIAVAVLSLVLSISFSLSNRSTQGNRQAQERSEAAKITESQIELLKTYISKSSTPVLPSAGSKFCMKADGSGTVTISGAITPNAQDDTFNAFSDPTVAACNTGEYFHTYIERDAGSTDTYTAHTRWYKVAGRGIDEATMVHRLYPDLASAGEDSSTGTENVPANSYRNSVGGVSTCPPGFGSPAGSVGASSCQAIPPKIIVNVKKIPPDPGSNTPSCDKAATENKADILVNLTRPGVNYSSTTDSASNALFDYLEPNAQYTATVTAPNKYEACPPSSQPVTAGGLGNASGVGTVTTVSGASGFKVRPICSQVRIADSVTTVFDHYDPIYYDNWHIGAGVPGLSGWYMNQTPEVWFGGYYFWLFTTQNGWGVFGYYFAFEWVNTPYIGGWNPVYREVRTPQYQNVCP